jgi:hypothetical protein
MAAGLGFKTFTTGEVLSAGDTNGYLMQGINVFANATARDAAITSPQEGQACYLKDTDAVMTYSGSAWVSIAPASSGGLTLLSTTTITSATTTISSISGSYNYLLIYINNLGTTNANPNLAITFNGASTFQGINSTAYDATAAAQFALNNSALTNASHPYSGAVGGQYQSGVLTLENYSNASYYKPITYNETFYNSSGQQVSSFYTGKIKTTSAITSMTVTWGGTTGITGTVKIYGGN